MPQPNQRHDRHQRQHYRELGVLCVLEPDQRLFPGNAPSLGLYVFDGDNNPTAYYLPGTTGWSTNFAGLPTVLWQPLVQTRHASFGVLTNQFGFNINWAGGMTVVVEACTNLANPTWSPLGTNTLTSGTAYFSDPQWTNYSARFYRLRSP